MKISLEKTYNQYYKKEGSPSFDEAMERIVDKILDMLKEEANKL